jgi:Tfp pilus assembly protein PilN
LSSNLPAGVRHGWVFLCVTVRRLLPEGVFATALSGCEASPANDGDSLLSGVAPEMPGVLLSD